MMQTQQKAVNIEGKDKHSHIILHFQTIFNPSNLMKCNILTIE